MILGTHAIADEFERFAKSDIPADASTGQHADMQRAYFSGVLLVLRLLEVLGALPEAVAFEALQELRREANAFAVSQIIIGVVLTHGDTQ
ncbi:hypothetical protein [Paraburkholderia terrae]|uniref:Uncharacterized protein n=1 Tax=Paraburkholderia terrae TaxID=311230 RepID=A0A2I8EUG5_9BURK|nr:hypothetical protein [Paraburkholderia terrae]AUT62911.1 hypothetical protein C2L65_25410 [Paraburkholderia terrae]